MKRTVVLFLSMVIIFSSLAISPVYAADETITIDGDTYIRTFYDDFDGNKLDSKKWSRAPEWYRQGNYCKWSKEMSYLDGEGHLILGCRYDDDGDLLCGAIRSRDKFEQCYGYFEASVKLQQVDGFWSAFWLMPNDIDLYGIPGGIDGTEIDIYEAFSVKNKSINLAVHFDGYGSNHKMIGTSVTADVYDGEYHKFSLLWDKKNYIFYIDGKETYRLTSSDVRISRVPNYLKFSLESSLGWTGKPDAEDMPSGISVDYVKVYQKAVLGDIDINVKVNLTDVKKFGEFLSKEVADIEEINADLNCDGKVDIKDYLILRKYVAELITELPYKEDL